MPNACRCRRRAEEAGRHHDGRQLRLRLRGGKARPGIAMALRHDHKPDTVATVFAGADIDATDRARAAMTGFPPSSPSIALFQDGKLVYMVERRDIEQRTAEGIADLLTLAFDKYCAEEKMLG
jgi:putative YphP/YqiW family bacilliredoxin